MPFKSFALWVDIFHLKATKHCFFSGEDKFSKKMSSSILKVVFATFLLVYFACLKESTCETRKNVFYFTSKAVFVLEIIKYYFKRYSNIMMSSNAQA